MPQLPGIIHFLLRRELETIKREIAAFPDDSSVWMPRPGVTNTAGTLALHCAGNLQHFVGARLGNTGYVRKRELEFSRRDVPREEILAELDRAIAAITVLQTKRTEELPAVFPDEFGGKQVNTDVLLAQLLVHIGYHLGQIDYHRRMITGNTATVNAIAAQDLPAAV